MEKFAKIRMIIDTVGIEQADSQDRWQVISGRDIDDGSSLKVVVDIRFLNFLTSNDEGNIIDVTALLEEAFFDGEQGPRNYTSLLAIEIGIVMRKGNKV